MKKKFHVWLPALLVLAGIIIAAYPFISNYIYEHSQQEVITAYESQQKENGNAEKELKEAQEYNKSLADANVTVTDPFDPEALSGFNRKEYETLLDANGEGMMGYLEIPVIGVRLGIYHGTDEKVLKNGVGHLKNTSLPIGGEGTHAVLSAHTGLPEKKLFTDLELMKKGDVFYLHVSGETLAYETDRIKVVEPYNTGDLRIQEGKDYVTLVTCTPYGINSHRLLVRGKRIPFAEKAMNTEIEERKGSQWLRQYFFGVAAGFFIIILFVGTYKVIHTRRK
ncbi:MAG: class C sortase [Eubacteriales bacterium]|nr:class C sortase [Eubacteriales bacterium]